jgi:phosphoribosylformylglycinamidine synthase
MRFGAEVAVMLKPGIADPQGQTIERALPALGWSNVSHVRVGKSIRLRVDAADEGDAVALQIRADQLVLDGRPPLIRDADGGGTAPGGDRAGAASGRDRGDGGGRAHFVQHRVETGPGVLLNLDARGARLIGREPRALNAQDAEHDDAQHGRDDQQLGQGEPPVSATPRENPHGITPLRHGWWPR